MKRTRPGWHSYLYCLVQQTKVPSVANAPPGLPGLRRPRLLETDPGLWLIVADAPPTRYGAARIERGLRDLSWVSACAMAHEEVVEHFTGSGTVVPMKLFTLFTSDARALASLKRRRGRLQRVIGRLAGRQEWGVRASFDVARAVRRARARIRRETAAETPGIGFLLRKKREQDLGRRLTDETRLEVDRAFRHLTRQADEARRRTATERAPGGRVVLDAAFLVPVKRAARFRAEVQRWATRLATRGCEVVLTGPWPAYNFVGDAFPAGVRA